MNMLELQEKFIGELLKDIDGPWDRIEVHYEYFVWDGDAIQNYTSEIITGQAADDLMLPPQALRTLAALRECKPEGQTEPWTWLEFRMDNTGAYKFDYKYGTPPLAAEEIKFPGA